MPILKLTPTWWGGRKGGPGPLVAVWINNDRAWEAPVQVVQVVLGKRSARDFGDVSGRRPTLVCQGRSTKCGRPHSLRRQCIRRDTHPSFMQSFELSYHHEIAQFGFLVAHCADAYVTTNSSSEIFKGFCHEQQGNQFWRYDRVSWFINSIWTFALGLFFWPDDQNACAWPKFHKLHWSRPWWICTVP
jgi:hypothetical protein